MAEDKTNTISQEFKVRHRGRGAQIGIYLGKMLRMFIYQNDWKVLPMAALIAGMVGMVLHRRMFVTMEGTQVGSFALVCVCIWNGFFNSIQVICRERDVIKREHRSGMHISSYVASHMLYQALLCLLQTGITLYVTYAIGIEYPAQGLLTPWFLLDIGITFFLITYAADMLSLWISSLSHSTTAAMTVMPFILIFQLIFSGGLFNLPNWADPITNYTVSGPGMKVIASQADTNNLPSVTIGNLLDQMRNDKVTDDEDMTFGELYSIVGEQQLKEHISEKAAHARQNPDYENSRSNIVSYWIDLAGFVILFALLTVITLEFIDKDKR